MVFLVQPALVTLPNALLIVVSWQYVTLARLLLTAYDPETPRVGLDRHAVWLSNNVRSVRNAYNMWLTIQASIQSLIRLLCSIAVSNPTIAPATIVASMGIMLGGDIFTERAEQDVLLHVLNQAEMEHGWPTAALQKRLQEAWTQIEMRRSAGTRHRSTNLENVWHTLAQRSSRRQAW